MNRRSFRPAAARMLAAGVLAAGLAVPATASAGVLDSVSGWWPMYEGSGQTVHDLSGHGNNGTLGSTPSADSNDPTWIKGWLFGSALRFDGDDFVRIPNKPQLNSANLTVSTWVRGSASPGTARYIVGKGATGCESASYGLYTGPTGGLRFYIWDAAHGAIGSGIVDPSQIWNGKWHHVAGTWDGTTAKLFVDGKLISGSSSAPGTIDYNQGPGDVGIGDFLGTCDLFYTGDIDDVAIFSQALPIDKYWSALSLLFPKPLR
jgi:hypothetical protein